MEGSYRLFSNSRQKKKSYQSLQHKVLDKNKSPQTSHLQFLHVVNFLRTLPCFFQDLTGVLTRLHTTQSTNTKCVVSKASSFTVTKSCTTAQGLSVNNALDSSQPLWAMTAVGRERVENVGFHLYCRLNLWQNGCFMAACVWNNINVGFAAVQNSL